VTCMALLLPSCGGSEGPEPSGKGQASIIEFSGDVTVNGEKVSQIRKLDAGDEVHAPKGGVARIKFDDGARFLLVGRNGEGATFTVQAPKDDKGVLVMLVKVGSGIATFFVPPENKGKSRYEIEAVTSLTVVRGTEGKVEVQEGGALIALKSGTVDIIEKVSGKTTTLNRGQEVVITEEGGVVGPHPYDFSGAGEKDLYGVKGLTIKVFDK